MKIIIEMEKIHGGVFYNDIATIHHHYISEHKEGRSSFPFIYIIELCESIIASEYDKTKSYDIEYKGKTFYAFIEFVKDKKVFISVYGDNKKRNEIMHISLMAIDNYPHITFIKDGKHYSIYYKNPPYSSLEWNYPLQIIDTIETSGILDIPTPKTIPRNFWRKNWMELENSDIRKFRNLLEPLKMVIEKIATEIPFIITPVSKRPEVMEKVNMLMKEVMKPLHGGKEIYKNKGGTRLLKKYL